MTSNDGVIRDRIARGLAGGGPITVTYDDCIAGQSGYVAPVGRVEFSPPLALDPSRLADLLPSGASGDLWQPPGAVLDLFKSGPAFALATFSYGLDLQAKKLKSLTFGIEIASAPATGLDIGGARAAGASFTVTQIVAGLYLPMNEPPDISVALECDLVVGPARLYGSIALPDLVLRVRDGSDATIADILGGFGITPFDRAQTLKLASAEAMFDLRQGSGEFAAVLAATDSFDLIPDVVALRDIAFSLSYVGGTVEVGLEAGLTFRKALKLDAKLGYQYQSGSRWSIDAALAEPITVGALLADVLRLGKPGLAALENTTIDRLDVGLDLVGGRIDEFRADASFSALWEIAGESSMLETSLDVLGTDDYRLAARLHVDHGEGIGTDIRLEYAHKAGTLEASLPLLSGIVARLDMGKADPTFTFTNQAPFTLGDLVGGFVALFDAGGNPHLMLPEPWDALGGLVIPAGGISLTVDLKTKDVTLLASVDWQVTAAKITSFGVTYAKPKGHGKKKKTLGLVFNCEILGRQESFAWDPTNPAAAPSPPARPPFLMVDMVALGRHIALGPAPGDDVRAVAKTISGVDMASPSAYDWQAGWLIGANLTLLGAIDCCLVYTDRLTGLNLRIKRDTSIAFLAYVAGIEVEIRYRTLDEALGVFEGTLQFGDGRLFDFGAFKVRFPGIYAAIYTNGDFLIDAGYPRNGDFSHSFLIEAAQYMGSGGAYLGRLSGQTADGLPKVNPALGRFTSVNKLGIGLRLGILRDETHGPLVARAELYIEAVFEGTLAHYVRHAGGESDDYFAITALLGAVGMVHVSIDLGVVKASVLAEFAVCALITAEAHKAVDVLLEATVAIVIDLIVSCGLFDIRVGYRCDLSIKTAFQLGTPSTALYLEDAASAAAGVERVSAAKALAAVHRRFRFRDFTFTDEPAFTLLVTPVLTAGAEEDGVAAWRFVVQTALDGADGKLAGSDFGRFVRLAATWFVDAAWAAGGKPGSFKSCADLAAALTISRARIAEIIAMLHAQSDEAAGKKFWDEDRPSARALLDFVADRAFTLARAQDSHPSLVFVPMPPCFAVEADEGSFTDPDHGDFGRRTALTGDYLAVLATALLVEIDKRLDETATLTLGQAFTKLDDAAYGAVAAFAMRYVFHGQRVSTGGRHARSRPLYAVLGQQQQPKAHPAEPYVLKIVEAHKKVKVTYGRVLLDLRVAQRDLPDDQILVRSNPVLTGTVTAGGMTPFRRQPEAFALTAEAWPGGLTLFRFPHRLQHLVDAQQAALGNAVLAEAGANARWCVPIRFSARALPVDSQLLYELTAVDTPSLRALIELASAPLPQDTVIRLNCGGIALLPADQFRLWTANLSTEARPAAGQATSRQGMVLPVVDALLRGGLTRARGYYLQLPASLGADARAALGETADFVLMFDSAVPPRQRSLPYGAVLAAGGSRPTLALADRPVDQALLPPGFVTIEITRAVVTGEGLPAMLDRLFTFVQLSSIKLVDKAGDVIDEIEVNDDVALAPCRQDGWRVFRHNVDVGRPAICGKSLSKVRNPYALVGGDVHFAFKFRDLYGNALPERDILGFIPIRHCDPLTRLADWPGLSHSYRFAEVQGKPAIEIDLAFDARALRSDAEAADIARLVDRYRAIWFELADVTARIELPFATVAGNAFACNDAVEALRHAAAEIIAALTRKIKTTAKLKPIVIPIAEDEENYRFDLVSPLGAIFVLERSAALIDKSCTPTNDAERYRRLTCAPTRLVPATGQIAGKGKDRIDGDGIAAYTGFAAVFERVFARFGWRVLIGNPSGAEPDLRVIKIGEGGLDLSVTADAGAFGFAPKPLSPMAPNRMLREEGDADQVLAEAVAQIEACLRPEVAMLADEASPGFTREAIETKRQLAARIIAQVAALGDGQDADLLAAAKEKYRQACLTDLRNYYDIDAIAVLRMAMTRRARFQTHVPFAVDGHLVNPGGGTLGRTLEPVTFDAAQAAIRDHAGLLCVPARLREKASCSRGVLPGSYALEAIRFGSEAIIVGQDTGCYTVETGSWFRFATGVPLTLPVAGTAAGPVEVGLPNRARPGAPAFLRERAEVATPDHTKGVDTLVASLRGWTLTLSYDYACAGADALYIVLSTQPLTETEDRAARTLFPALRDLSIRSQAVLVAARAAARAGGATLTADVVRALTASHQDCRKVLATAQSMAAAIPEFGAGTQSVRFRLAESVDPATGALVISVAPVGTGWTGAMPRLAVPGRTANATARGTAVDYSFSPASPMPGLAFSMPGKTRIFSLDFTDVLAWPAVYCHLQVVRNDSLPHGFRYRSRPCSTLLPQRVFIDRREGIELGVACNASSVENLLEVLMTKDHAGRLSVAGTLVAHEGPARSLPAFYLPPRRRGAAAAGEAIAAAVDDRLAALRLLTSAKMVLELDIIVFKPDEDMPMLRLHRAIFELD